MERISFPNLVWLVLGMLMSALASAPVFIIGEPTLLSPFPMHVLLLLFVAGSGATLVLPVLFALQFLILYNRPNFLMIQLIVLAILWVLTPIYFGGSWKYGLRWMGEVHTASVFAIHFVGLSVLSGMAWAGFRRNLAAFNNLLNIFLFSFLTWGAFPILGEMP